MELDGVVSIQEPHFWTLCSNVYSGSVKIEVDPRADSRFVLSHTHNIFNQIGVKNVTVQIEYAHMWSFSTVIWSFCTKNIEILIYIVIKRICNFSLIWTTLLYLRFCSTTLLWYVLLRINLYIAVLFKLVFKFQKRNSGALSLCLVSWQQNVNTTVHLCDVLKWTRHLVQLQFQVLWFKLFYVFHHPFDESSQWTVSWSWFCSGDFYSRNLQIKPEICWTMKTVNEWTICRQKSPCSKMYVWSFKISFESCYLWLFLSMPSI